MPTSDPCGVVVSSTGVDTSDACGVASVMSSYVAGSDSLSAFGMNGSSISGVASESSNSESSSWVASGWGS